MRPRLAMLLVCLMALSAAAAVGCAGQKTPTLSSNDVKAAVNRAEVHGGAAASIIVKAYDSESPGSIKGDPRVAARAVRKSVQQARDEIAASRDAMSVLPDSAGRTDYLAALQATTEMTKALEDYAALLDNQGGVTQKALKAGTLEAQIGQVDMRFVSASTDADKFRTQALNELGVSQ